MRFGAMQNVLGEPLETVLYLLHSVIQYQESNAAFPSRRETFL